MVSVEEEERGEGSRQGPAGALDLYTWWAIRRALEMGSMLVTLYGRTPGSFATRPGALSVVKVECG